MSTIISKSSQVSDLEFDLNQVKGKVVTTKNVIVPAFQTVIARGLTKVTGHQKHVHVLVEPSPKCASIFVPGNTSKLIQGGTGVVVVPRNLSRKDIMLEPHTEIGKVTTANIVPSIQIPSKQDLSESGYDNGKVQCKSAQVSLSEDSQQEDVDPKKYLTEIDLLGLLTGIPWYNRKLKTYDGSIPASSYEMTWT